MNRQKTIHGKEKPLWLPKGRACKQCVCGNWFSLPACHAARHNSCSKNCLDTLRAERKRIAEAERTRHCLICNATFIARPWQIQNGIGRFCSNLCVRAYSKTTEAFKAGRFAAAKTVKERRLAGTLPPQTQPKGEDSPYWKGGAEISRQRMRAKGSLKAYRNANPDKVREWSQRRHGRKTGRLPRGTVAELLEKQMHKCAICTKRLKDGYHVDHIMPLALNGKHERLNIQILCQTCNVRKSAKHPIRYAQELGRLL